MEKSVFESLIEYYTSKEKNSLGDFCSKQNNENLFCGTFVVKTFNKITKSQEDKILDYISIKDDKYGINGVYLVDSLQDNNTLAHFLFPVMDINNYKNKIVDTDTKEPNICSFMIENKNTKSKSLYCLFAQTLLKHQHVINVIEEREKFKEKLLERAENINEDEYEKMKERLSGENSFKSTSLEYAFSKYAVSKICKQSAAIELRVYRDALTEVYMQSGKLFCESFKLANQVIENSKKEAFSAFTSHCANKFFAEAKTNFNRKQALVDEIINHKNVKGRTKE